MHLTLLTTLPADNLRTRTWLSDGLTSLGHDLHLVDRFDLPASGASTLGYGLAERWRESRPDAVIALGWVAGLAAQVAARERPVPLLLRLPRPGRSGNPAVTRVEAALVRGGAAVLAASSSEAESLVRLGAPRPRIRVLPEAVDLGSATSHHDGVVVADDDTAPLVTAVLEGMAAGRPAVVAQRGVLPDLVADGVTGLVVPPGGDLQATARSLAADPMQRESMGMAAADRARACFDTAVVVPMLGRLLDEVQVVALSGV
jgi:glycosyltransferase involved in cell wall biosynthesis